MPLRKIGDIPRPCASSDHNPPSHIVLEPGIYEHTCSACGKKTVFTVTTIISHSGPPALTAHDVQKLNTVYYGPGGYVPSPWEGRRGNTCR